MGSMVLDAMSSLFGQPSNHAQHASTFRDPRQHHPSPQPHRTRTPSRAEAYMSEPGQRAPGSAASQNEPSAGESARHSRPSSQVRPQLPGQHGATPRPRSPPLAPTSQPPQSDPPSALSHHDSVVASSQSGASGPGRPKKIKVRDLQHIREFAGQDVGSFAEIRSRSRSRSRGAGEDETPQYEISGMKPEDIIEMVAGLLTKITTTNDRQHEHLHRQPPAIDSATHLNSQTSSVLAFHGKNVPSITILSYLSRINKYCPTSIEVFLALLVYFDRMTERVNAGPMQSLRELNRQAVEKQSRSASASTESLGSDRMEDVKGTEPRAQLATPPSSGSMEQATQHGVPGTPHSRSNQPDSPLMSPEIDIDPYNLSHFFVVDSFNIHRLVIAGVTCASKFFSDIFYTNSRYAKVGGLPLAELNHLELQFLLLNDFRLSVPVEELEAYGTMLVEFYAREVIAQQKAAQAMQMRSLSESSSDSTSTVHAAG